MRNVPSAQRPGGWKEGAVSQRQAISRGKPAAGAEAQTLQRFEVPSPSRSPFEDGSKLIAGCLIGSGGQQRPHHMDQPE